MNKPQSSNMLTGLLILLCLASWPLHAAETLTLNPQNPGDPRNPLPTCTAPCVWSAARISGDHGIANHVTITKERQVVVAGYGDDPSFGAFVRAYSIDGKPLWIYSGAGTGHQANIPQFSAVAAHPSGGVMAVGHDYSANNAASNSGGSSPWAAGWLVRFDGQGKVLWQHRDHGDGEHRRFRAVTALPDGRIAVLGYWDVPFDSDTRRDFGKTRPFVTLFTADGTKIWTKLLKGGRDNIVHDITVFDGDHLLAIGRVKDYRSNMLVQVWAAKFAIADGALLWDRHHGGAESDAAYGVIVLENGQALLAGNFGGFTARRNMKLRAWTLIIDADGNHVSDEINGVKALSRIYVDVVAAGGDRALTVGWGPAGDIALREFRSGKNIGPASRFGGPWADIPTAMAYDRETDRVFVAGSTEVPQSDTSSVRNTGWLVALEPGWAE